RDSEPLPETTSTPTMYAETQVHRDDRKPAEIGRLQIRANAPPPRLAPHRQHDRLQCRQAAPIRRAATLHLLEPVSGLIVQEPRVPIVLHANVRVALPGPSHAVID